MSKYNKLIVAVIGALVTAAATFGVIDEGTASSIISQATPFVTALGVWFFANKQEEAMFKYLLVFALFLGGCAGAVPWNPQGNAGMTQVVVKWCKVQNAEGTAREACKVTVTDGKESSLIDFKFSIGDSVLNFYAEDTAAFEGQRIRADVEGQVIEATEKIISEGLDLAGNILVPVPDLSSNEEEESE